MSSIKPSSITLHDGNAGGLPVVVGCPFQVGSSGWTGKAATVQFVDGTQAPAQCATLNPPNPNGVQWVELSFNAMTKGAATVTLHAAGGDGDGLVTAAESGAIVQNACIRVTLDARAEQAPVTIEVRAGGAWQPMGRLMPEIVTEKGLVHRDTGAYPRTVTVLRDGPLRGQVELQGQLATLSGKPSMSYRLTVELWQGAQAVRVDWMLGHLAPGMPAMEVQRATLVGEWQVGEKTQRRFIQSHYGPYYRTREVTNPAPVALVADFTCSPVHVEDPSMLLDDIELPRHLVPPLVNTGEWLGLEGERGSVYATLIDFTDSRPNKLESAGNRLNYHLIPDGHVTHWPQGRRREQTLLLTFGHATAGEVGQRLAVAYPAGRALPTAETLAALDCFEMPLLLKHRPGRNTRLTGILRGLCNLNTPGDKWNIGDTQDLHYTATYAPIPNRFERVPGAPELPVQFTTGAGNMLYPYWARYFVEPVWTNNEYDGIHMLAQEMARTGRKGHHNMLRWAARHNIEVDFLAYSDDRWHHRATPAHSQHHNTTGAYPSHFWSQGLLEYYLLTGDRDAYEVAVALGDKAIENLQEPDVCQMKFDREFGWGLLTLVCLVEVTGLARFREECDRIADFFQAYDRAGHSGAVNLSAGDASKSLERQMIDNAFGYGSLIEAMDRYQRASGRQDTAAWLVVLLDQLREALWEAIDEGSYAGNFTLLMMAIGYERTGNPDFLRAGMVVAEHMLTGLQFNLPDEVKPSAITHRSLCRFLGHADRANLLDRFEIPGVLERRLEREQARGGHPG